MLVLSGVITRPGLLCQVVALLLAMVAGSASAVELTILEWEKYISPYTQEFEAYAHAQGVDVHLNFLKNPDGSQIYVSNAEQIFTALRIESVDIVTPTNSYYKRENQQIMKLTLPLAVARMPNYPDIHPVLRNVDFMRDTDGSLHGVPLLGGSYALAYNADHVAEPKSWTVLLQPAARGRYSVTTDQFEANIFQMALLAGVRPPAIYDSDQFTPAQIAETQRLTNALVAGSAAYWAGNPNIEQMRSLDYVTDYWFGTALANAAGQHWKIASPKEGATLWCDTMAIGRHLANDPEKLKASYLLLDFMISPAIQARIVRNFGIVAVNPKARAYLSKEQAALVPEDDFFKPALFWQPLSRRTRNRFKILWNEANKAVGRSVSAGH